MWHLQMASSYLLHRILSNSPHRLQSPYLLSLMGSIRKHSRTFPDLENLRRKLLTDNSIIVGEDYGAGSKGMAPQRVSDIARHSLSSVRRSAFLHGLVKATGVQRVMELGTSLGISAAYIDRALPANGQLLTIEGNSSISALAKLNLEKIGATKTQVITGPFDQHLDRALDTLPELLIIDGNHRKDATLNYVAAALHRKSPPQFILLDDIRWSHGMSEAWEEVIHRSDISISLDFFHFGLLLTSRDFARQHVKVRHLP
jgi:predicted O-methyltransferase YrrM